MKSITDLLLILIKLYCGFKIFQWLYLQSIDKTSHPISEIQHILVFVLFDIWMILSVNQINEKINTKV